MFRSLMTKSAVAIAAVGMSTFTAVSAQAAAFTPTNNPGTCTVGQVTIGQEPGAPSATSCAGIYTGQGLDSNPAPGTVESALNNGDLFGNINAWTFDRRVQSSDPSFGSNDLELTLTGLGTTSGTFTFGKINPEITRLVIGLKAANNYVLYFIDKGTYAANTVFTWSTSDLRTGNNSNSQVAALSNFNVFYQVPTPALLPGLIGMGVAALRKKTKDEADANA